jgi:hypothetical protein
MGNETPCPGCGKPVPPINHLGGPKKKYCSLNCGAKMRMRRMNARNRQKKLRKQRPLEFQPAAHAERRVKSRSIAEQGREEKDERLFA